MNKVMVTGGSGFIGSHIVDKLVNMDKEVVIYDNLSSGYREFTQHHSENPKVSFIEDDILNLEKLTEAMSDVDFVFHMAANPDIRYGIEHSEWDLQQNTIGTYNVLEAMRVNGTNKIAFASTSASIGEATVIPTPEDYGPMRPLSLYGLYEGY